MISNNYYTHWHASVFVGADTSVRSLQQGMYLYCIEIYTWDQNTLNLFDVILKTRSLSNATRTSRMPQSCSFNAVQRWYRGTVSPINIYFCYLKNKTVWIMHSIPKIWNFILKATSPVQQYVQFVLHKLDWNVLLFISRLGG